MAIINLRGIVSDAISRMGSCTSSHWHAPGASQGRRLDVDTCQPENILNYQSQQRDSTPGHQQTPIW